jgi:hypothetical protein
MSNVSAQSTCFFTPCFSDFIVSIIFSRNVKRFGPVCNAKRTSSKKRDSYLISPLVCCGHFAWHWFGGKTVHFKYVLAVWCFCAARRAPIAVHQLQMQEVDNHAGRRWRWGRPSMAWATAKASFPRPGAGGPARHQQSRRPVPHHAHRSGLVWWTKASGTRDENFCSSALAFLKEDGPAGRREKESKCATS